jgi:uncharacterized protein (DUF2062 family)
VKIRDALRNFLKQGMSPRRLALCVAIGITVGNIPILGVSTILCLGLALAFRLNLPAIQLVQAAMAPTQLILIIPFVRLGEWLLHAPHQALSLQEGTALIRQGVGHAVTVLWDAILHAGFAWLLVAPPAILLLHQVLTRVFQHAADRMDDPATAAPAAPAPPEPPAASAPSAAPAPSAASAPPRRPS